MVEESAESSLIQHRLAAEYQRTFPRFLPLEYLAVDERNGVEYGACYFSGKSWIHEEACDNVLVIHY